MATLKATLRSHWTALLGLQKAESPSLEVGLKWSAALHVLVIIIILLKSFVFPGRPVPYIPTLRVDLVGLPDILKKDLNQSTPEKAKEAGRKQNQEVAKILKEAEIQERKQMRSHAKSKAKEIAKPNEMVMHPKETAPTKQLHSKNMRALDRLKSLAKLQKLEETGSKAATGALIKGNHLSPGSSLSGEAKEAAEAHYFDLIRERLLENWELPTWLSRQKLSSQVTLYLDSNGKLSRFEMVQSSGNAQFDEAVKQTIQESEPFPSPPAELRSLMLSNGILLGFPL